MTRAPCGACKHLRRKCSSDCVFAPYFPADQPEKFLNVHKVYGASNVGKLLSELNPSQRADLANSLVYEANARLKDPIYGAAGLISILQQQLQAINLDIYNAKKELSSYIGPSAMLPIISEPPATTQQQPSNNQYNMTQMMELQAGLSLPAGPGSHNPPLVIREPASRSHNPPLVIREPNQQQQQQQQILEAQELAAQQEMLRCYQQQHQFRSQQQHQAGPSRGGFNEAGSSGSGFQQEFLRVNKGLKNEAGPSGSGMDQQQQMFEAQQLREQQEMLRFYQQHQMAGSKSPFLALGQFDNTIDIQQQPQGDTNLHQLLALGSFDNPIEIGQQQPREHSNLHQLQQEQTLSEQTHHPQLLPHENTLHPQLLLQPQEHNLYTQLLLQPQEHTLHSQLQLQPQEHSIHPQLQLEKQELNLEPQVQLQPEGLALEPQLQRQPQEQTLYPQNLYFQQQPQQSQAPQQQQDSSQSEEEEEEEEDRGVAH